jgi:outer membrane protein TolC
MSANTQCNVSSSRHVSLAAGLLLPALTLICGCATRPESWATSGIITRETIHDASGPEEKLIGPLTADTAVALALKHNPAIIDLREQVSAAKAARVSVLAANLKDPEFRMAYGQNDSMEHHYKETALTNAPWIYIPRGQAFATNLIDSTTIPVSDVTGSARSLTTVPGAGDGYQASIQVPIPNPWLISRQKTVADTCVAAAKADLKAKEWQIELDVRKAVEDLQHLQEDIAAIDKLIALQSGTVAMLQARIQQGTATLVDSVSATTKHLTAISDRVSATQNYQQSIGRIAELMGVGASGLIFTSASAPLPDLVPQAVDCAFLQAIAGQNRPDINSLIWKVRVADSALREARTASIPWFAMVQGLYSRSDVRQSTDPVIQWTGTDGTVINIPSRDTVYEDNGQSSWRIDAAITIPLFTWLTDDTAPQRADCTRSRTALSCGYQRMAAEVRDAAKTLQVTHDSLTAYKSAAAPDLALLKSIQLRAKDNGVITPDEDAKIEAEFIQHERIKRQLEYGYRKALLELTKAVGRDLGFIWGGPPDVRVNAKDVGPVHAAVTDESADPNTAPVPDESDKIPPATE